MMFVQKVNRNALKSAYNKNHQRNGGNATNKKERKRDMPKFYTKYEKAVEAARELNEENNELAKLTFIVTDGEQFAIADGRANLRAAGRLGFDLAAAVKGGKVSRQYDEILNDLYMNTDERDLQTDDGQKVYTWYAYHTSSEDQEDGKKAWKGSGSREIAAFDALFGGYEEIALVYDDTDGTYATVRVFP